MRIKRFFVKYYVRWRVRQYLAFFPPREGQQSNENIAKARFMKARIMYWQNQFEAWGKYNIVKPYNFGFTDKTIKAMEEEMIWMGFTRELRNKEWDITKNEEYPWTVSYYPHENTKFKGGHSYPLNYREIKNPKTGTYENYEIPKSHLK